MYIKLSKEFIDDLVRMIEYKINIKKIEQNGEVDYLVNYVYEFRRKYQGGEIDGK